MRRLFLIFFTVAMHLALLAQEDIPEEEVPTAADSIPILNRLNVNQDSRMDEMLSWHIENNKNRAGIEGY
jgi:hypothetical protein